MLFCCQLHLISDLPRDRGELHRYSCKANTSASLASLSKSKRILAFNVISRHEEFLTILCLVQVDHPYSLAHVRGRRFIPCDLLGYRIQK